MCFHGYAGRVVGRVTMATALSPPAFCTHYQGHWFSVVDCVQAEQDLGF